jgi:hypothetical protein
VKLSLKNANVAVLREAVKVAAAAGDGEHLAFLRGGGQRSAAWGQGCMGRTQGSQACGVAAAAPLRFIPRAFPSSPSPVFCLGGKKFPPHFDH